MAKQPFNFNKAQDMTTPPANNDANAAKADGSTVILNNPTPTEQVPAPKEADQNPPMGSEPKENYDIKVLVVNKSNMLLPKYETANSAGLDVRANLTAPTVLPAHGRMLIGTGLFVAIPEGYECQVRPRSGLALKHGITVLNTPGTIDADYRGEIGVILMNHTDENYVINPGDKIAQLVFHKYERIKWQDVDKLPTTDRGEGGFGHTGK